MTVTIHNGDALMVLKSLPDATVNCVVTSPPYWGLRDYGVKGQIGLEKTPGEIIKADPVDPHKFRVRIGREVFIIAGKNLEEAKGER